MKRIIYFFCLILFSVSAFGQAKVRGHVLDENNEPMVGANVVIENTYYGASTDINGKFIFSGVPVGNYSLKVS